MEQLLSELASQIREKIPNELIAFDGQTCRGTGR